MKADRKALVLPAIVLVLAGIVLAVVNLGGGGDDDPAGVAAARSTPSAPLELALKQSHRSGVSGTARLVPGAADLEVTLTVDERAPVATLFAHIHTGPCSNEPTLRNPRIWANLTDVIDGRSETTVNVVTLEELRSETSSINVHDPEHGNRSLVCGDIPPAS